MMNKSQLHITLLVVGCISLVFVAVGLFAPAWLVYDMTYQRDTKIEIGLGLFSGHACVQVPNYGETCASFSEDDIMSHMPSQSEFSQAAVRGLFENFLAAQIMTVLGTISSIMAICFKIAFKRSDQRSFGVLAACLWILSGILLIAAVGYQANQNHNASVGADAIKAMPELKDVLELEIHFPWALFMTGIGAALKFVCGLIISLHLCYGKDGEGVGSWNKFTNQAI